MSNTPDRPASSGEVKRAFRVEISRTEKDFELAAARAILASIKEAMLQRGRCLVALSGGRTPIGVYRRLGALLRDPLIDLSRLYLSFVDERMVPPDNADSNYGMVQREFLSQISQSPVHVFRIKGELNPEDAARDYEQNLQTVLPLFDGRCDLMLLGVGADGHTASLFPKTEVLHEKQRAAREVFAPGPGTWRVTLTLPTINRARAAFFLVAGKQKADIVGKIFAAAQPREDIPASLVRPDSGTLTWLLDADAASQIPPERSTGSAGVPPA
jgi:6-phosphogluconolactonase